MFKPTIILLVTTALVWAAYDIWAVSHNYAWTISATVWDLVRNHDYGPAVVASVFFLIGHVLFPNKASK